MAGTAQGCGLLLALTADRLLLLLLLLFTLCFQTLPVMVAASAAPRAAIATRHSTCARCPRHSMCAVCGAALAPRHSMCALLLVHA